MKKIIIGAIAVWLGASYWVMESRIAPAPETVGPPPASFQALEAVSFTTSDGWNISGWMAPASGKASTIILLHQFKATRWAMLERARFLHKAGYGVLLYDARGCGESEGDRVSFGIHERKDLIAAVAFLKSRDVESIGAIGRSQGAATILFAANDIPIKAVVLESAYDDLYRTFQRRMETHLGFYIPMTDLPLWWMMKCRLGFTNKESSPMGMVERLDLPKFFIAGTQEKRLPVEDTQRLYAQAYLPKGLWLVDGAAHEDFYTFSPDDYRERVTTFFSKNLP